MRKRRRKEVFVTKSNEYWEQQSRFIRRWVVGGLLVIAILVSIFGVYAFRGVLRLIGESERVTGHVVSVGEATTASRLYDPMFHPHAPRSETTWRLVIEYEVDGKRLIVNDDSSYLHRWGYQVGDEVPVLYTPRDPKQAVVGTFTELWGTPFGVLCFVLLILGIAGGFYVMSAPPRKEESIFLEGPPEDPPRLFM